MSDPQRQAPEPVPTVPLQSPPPPQQPPAQPGSEISAPGRGPQAGDAMPTPPRAGSGIVPGAGLRASPAAAIVSPGRAAVSAQDRAVRLGEELKEQLGKEAPLIVAEGVGRVLEHLAEGCLVYKHKLGSGGRGKDRKLHLEVADHKIRVWYRSHLT